MSYAVSGALQSAVFQRLSGDAALATHVGTAIYDSLPAGSLPAIYVVLGSENVRDRSDQTGAGADHDFTVSVICSASGFQMAKQAAGAVSDALQDADLTLSRGTLVGLRFRKAAARREGTGAGRRIDMTFRARVADD